MAPDGSGSAKLTTPSSEDILDVADSEQLVRHLDPSYHWDPQHGRPNTGAFRSHELSVDREGMRPADVACIYHGRYGFARLAVSVPRSELSLVVRKDPLVPDPPVLFEPEPSEDYNPGHAVILEATGKSDAKRMRDASSVIYPPGECGSSAEK